MNCRQLGNAVVVELQALQPLQSKNSLGQCLDLVISEIQLLQQSAARKMH